MTQEKDQDSAKVSLEEKVAEWDTRVDEAKVQLSLSGMEAQDALRPFSRDKKLNTIPAFFLVGVSGFPMSAVAADDSQAEPVYYPFPPHFG